MKISVLSKRETSDVIERMREKWKTDLVPKVKSLKSYEIENDKHILLADDLILVKVENEVVPFLGDAKVIGNFPSVFVDMGAVKFVCNGAKIMRPGIRKFDSFKKGDIVVVKDEVHQKTLAVGISLEDSETAATMTKGYVIDNLHYISDKIWEGYKEIKV